MGEVLAGYCELSCEGSKERKEPCIEECCEREYSYIHSDVSKLQSKCDYQYRYEDK